MKGWENMTIRSDRRRRQPAGPKRGDIYEQRTGRHAGRVIEVDRELGLTASARNHIARAPGTPHAERVRRRRYYYLVTTLHPDHQLGRVYRVSEATLGRKYVVIPKGTSLTHLAGRAESA
jgi:hypothetical protein